jgi:acyl-homoserine-lactone acylase
MTLEDVVRLKHDPRMLAAVRLKDDLLAAIRAAPPDTLAAPAARVLERWDDTVAPEARGAVLFEAWLARYLDDPATRGRPFGARWKTAFATPWSAASPMTTPDGLADPARAVGELSAAAAETLRRFGSLDVAWGDVHRVRRGSVDVPVAGCSGLYGCFRVLWFDQAADGKRVARGGDGWVLAVELGDPPRAYSVLAYGESNRPESPHYSDQAAMFARGELKRVAFTEADIAKQTIRRYRPGAATGTR